MSNRVTTQRKKPPLAGAKRTRNFAAAERIALALPGVETGTSYGTPALRVGKKFMARLRDDDPDVLVLTPVYDDEQRFLMETQPDVFFKTAHYVGHPSVLIRLSKVDAEQLRELIEQAWRRLATPRLIAERDGAGGRVAPAARKRAPGRGAARRPAR